MLRQQKDLFQITQLQSLKVVKESPIHSIRLNKVKAYQLLHRSQKAHVRALLSLNRNL